MHFYFAQYKKILRFFQDLKQKGQTGVFILVGILITLVILLIPIPQKSSDFCLMMVGVDCSKGWILGDPLWKRIKNSLENKSGSSQACAQDAKICPDGSYVGRTGSKCEFAECPVADDQDKSEEYCHKFNHRNCPDTCGVGPSCPICADIGCHAKQAHWGKSNMKLCAQVITPARNLQTDECQTFSTACIPEGWKVDRVNCKVDLE